MPALDTKYRPQSLEKFLGNKALKTSLETILTREKDIPNAFMFHGPAGMGKTTLGRIVANMLGCSELDYYELNISDTRGIEAARTLIENAKYKPIGGKIKIYCLDEVHMATKEFVNALLKTLEEPPPHLKFILCTTEPEKIIATIKQRCRMFEVKPLLQPTVRELLLDVLEQEGINNFPKEAIKKISELCQGSARQALNILDKVIDIASDEELLEFLDNEMEVLKQEAAVIDLCRVLLNKSKWEDIALILTNLKDTNYEKIRIAVLNYCTSVLLKKNNLQAAVIIECFSQPFFNTNKAGLVFACYQSVT